MIRRSIFLGISWIALSVACGGGEPPPPVKTPVATAASTPPATPPKQAEAPKVQPSPLDVDPVAVGLAPGGIEKLCDEGLARARVELESIDALDGKPDSDITWDSTLGRLDRVRLALRNAGDFPSLMAVAHPDQGVR